MPPGTGAAVARRGWLAGLAGGIGLTATLAALTLTVSLAVRPIASFDIGYHLVYGEHFLATRHIVDANLFIYTELDPAAPRDAESLGPGNWYDGRGNYRFVNANWLSQVVMALAYRAGGMSGMGVLAAVLVGAIFAVLILTMRRAGSAWHWIAAAVLLTGMTAYFRFDIRPELFGYLVLVAQWALLVDGRSGRGRLAGLVALQVLAVNVHSYFLLGIALAGAMLLDAFLRWLWVRSVTGAGADQLRPRLLWLAAAAAGMTLACLVNPWFIRGALLPIESILYFQHNGIPASQPGPAHPWANISEILRTFDERVRYSRATQAHELVLGLSAAAGLAAAARRRWGWLAALAGMAAVSLQMWRNIAVAVLILAPLSVIVLTDAWSWVRRRLAARVQRGLPVLGAGVGLAVLVLSGYWLHSVVTNRFYFQARQNRQFGLGTSAMVMPTGPADWINRHQPPGNVWTDFGTSSNILLLTGRPVPALTNTWAEPPGVLRWVMEIGQGLAPFEPAVEKYDIGTVVLQTQDITPLFEHLAGDRRWAVACVGPQHVVFIRRDGPTAELAARAALTPEAFDLAGFSAGIERQAPRPAEQLCSAGRLLNALGWRDQAAAVLNRGLQLQPDYAECVEELIRLYIARGQESYKAAMRPGGSAEALSAAQADLRQVEALLARLLELRPADAARINHDLMMLRRQLAAMSEKART